MPTSSIVVIHIMSTSYSGSTWVNCLLGGHSESFSIGELKNIQRMGRPFCDLHGDDCPLWTRFDHADHKNPFHQLHHLTNKRYLVVNNSRKFIHYQQEPGIESRFIHLIRDGRAVAASRLRKLPKVTMGHVARQWAHNVRRSQRLLRRCPGRKTELIYERIQADPEAELKRLCAFLEFDFEPGMLEYWNGVEHFLGGNIGTLTSLATKRGETLQKRPTSVVRSKPELAYYERTDPANFVADQRWRRELSSSQLWTFRLLAGRVNQALGYPQAKAAKMPARPNVGDGALERSGADSDRR